MSLRFVNCIFFGLVLFMNYLANALPLNGKNTGQLSDQYPNLFVPAGITFSIWGIIYLLLLIYCILQFFKKYSYEVKNIGALVIINFSLNAAWIVCWHFEYVTTSLLVMMALLLTLIYINKSLISSYNQFSKLAFGIYLGWICIATIANVTTLLVHINWDHFGIAEEIWTISMILLGGIIALIAMHRLQNQYLGLAVIWGFAGIMLKRSEDYPSIVVAAFISIILVATYTFYNLLKIKRLATTKM